jgi:L-ascorbate metabolism protein UlaG (beta-lactamase superfamily)
VIAAFQKDNALLADLARGHDGVWWLGQSGFLVRVAGSAVLFDPYLSDSLTAKYAGTDQPHERLTERVIDPARLGGLSVITSSHNHTDHLDAATLRPLFAANPQAVFIIPEANRAFVAQRLGTAPAWPLGLDDGTHIEVAGWRFTGIAAAHNAIDRDAQGRCHYLGLVAQRDGHTFFHSGDTLLYPGLADRLRAFRIDTAFLPINGHRPERRVAGNLDGREAAQLAHDIGARLVIPHHFGMFAFNTAEPDELFVPACVRLGLPHRVLRAGEGLALEP